MRLKYAIFSALFTVLTVGGLWLYGFSVAERSIPDCVSLAYADLSKELKESPLPRIKSLNIPKEKVSGRTIAPFLVRVSAQVPQSTQGALHGTAHYRTYWTLPWGISLRSATETELW